MLTSLKNFGLFGIVAFLFMVLVLGPYLSIWALNTLFPILNIPYNFETWFAMVVLTSIVRSAPSTNSNKKG